MSISPSQHQVFSQLLQQEQALVQRLLESLKQEHHALAARDTSAITKAVAAKEQAITDLQPLAEQRAQILQQVGLSADKQGFASFIASEPSGAMTAQWTELEAILHECQRQNQINGTLLETGRQVTQEMLGILTGREFGKNELYNQRGKTDLSMGQNTSFKV